MTLTVADLQAALALLPSDMPVVLAKDGEGNGFSPLSETQNAMYAADTTWSGEYYMTDEQRQATGGPDGQPLLDVTVHPAEGSAP